MIKGLSSRHEIKAKYTALNLALPHMDAQQFVKDNKGVMAEMIGLSTETPVLGKFVLAFFEALLIKLKVAGGAAAQDESTEEKKDGEATKSWTANNSDW